MIHKPIAWLPQLSFFKREQPLNDTWEIIKWWEVRRIPFNIIVGATGILTGIVILVAACVSELITSEATGWPDPPLIIIFAVIAYGIAANVCYTGGWIIELISKRVWNERAEAFGEISFTWGVLFAVGLTLLPAILVTGIDAILMVAHIFATRD